jgi:hypothetical protein
LFYLEEEKVMMRRYVQVSFLILAAACADPKYLPPNPPSPSPALGEKLVPGEDGTSSVCPYRFKTTKYCLNWKWEVLPTLESEGTFIFRVYRLDDRGTPIPVEGLATPELKLDMPSMGHDSGLDPVIAPLGGGIFRAEDVFFNMGGEWDLKFALPLEGGAKDFTVVRYVF